MKNSIRTFITAAAVSGLVFMTGCKEEEMNKESSKTDYMVLVNKQSKLPEDWEDRIELVDVYTGLDETYQVEKKAAEAYQKLRAALAEDHIIIELDSTYRTVEKQQEIWDEFMEEYGEEYTKKYVAVPGTSEHHTGLAIDVKLVKDGVIIDDNDDMTTEKELFDRIHARLAEFGFILRYPVGKEAITGYGSEVWHFRYVDDPKIAKEIMDQGLTLEEYLQKNS
ncbi:MAG: M15 family metallopeptidase [Solobacterium sp.]|nr:M15 family metallopeptidase [Solobacterium sp.]